tara:strand:- start:4101 stop:4433 length:333 start_codon:yes stop_codon:yes gene_type:complete
MNWIKDNLSVVTAVCAVVFWLGGIAVHAAIVQSEIEHGLSMAKSDREKMREDDQKIETRVKVVEDGQAAQKAQLVRIETRQQAIKETSQRIDGKLERLDSKLDIVIKRGR